MPTMARDAVLVGVGSHWIADEYGGDPEGISKEEVFPRFRATWRGRDCLVTMRAHRYAASFEGEGTRLTDWRVYATEAREHDENANGCRGDEVSGTAQRALGDLCEPLVRDWLASDAYAVSRRKALAHMVVRHLEDRYTGVQRAREAMARVELAPAARKGILAVLKAREAYNTARGDALTSAINAEEER
jgi:hypothetical protein